MDRFFFKIYNTIEQYRLAYLIVMLSVFATLFWTATTLNFDEDISQLIPSNNKNKKSQEVLNTVKFTDKIIVNISRGKGGELSDVINYASDFNDSISTHYNNYIKSIQGKVEDETALETIDFVYNNLPLFLNEKDYSAIQQKINPDSLKAITKANYKTIISPSGIIAKSTLLKDPLGLSFLGLKQLNQLGLADDFKLKDGFLVSKNEQHILLFLTPEFGTNETTKNLEFSNALYKLQRQLNSKFKNKASVGYYGGPLIAVANAQQIKIDIQTTLSIALSVLMIIFIVFYRKLTIPIILFVPTLFGGIFAISILSLLRTEISAISLGIGAVLLGVTLDYSLHILTQIRNKETVENVYKKVTKPILMSSITTALAFLCLLFINSQALKDLGIFAACSVIGASVFALIFIPQVYKSKSSMPIAKSSFIDRLSSYNFYENKLLVSGIIIVVFISIFTFGKVKFNKNLSELNYVSKPLKNAEKELDALTNISSKSLYIITFDEYLENALQSNDSIFTTLKQLKKEQAILGFNSIGALVKSEKLQNEQIEQWKLFWTVNKIEKLKNQLIENGSQLGFKPTTFQQFYEVLESDFKPKPVKAFKQIPALKIEDFITMDTNLSTVTSVVKINNNEIDAIKNTFKDFKNTFVIDRQGINETMLGDLKSEFNILILYSLMVIFILLLVFYKSLKLTLVTMIPILLTWFVTLGIMGLFQLEFNIFNIIISTFIFGLGIDYSIFITNGLLHQTKTKTDLLTHKMSVILSVITTVLGVGVLIFAKHPALHSLAVISIIGIGSAMLIAFTIQPLLFNFLILRTEKP